MPYFPPQQTAIQILNKLLTVDGSGSGLDADTIDGLHANELSTVAALNDLTDVTISTPSTNQVLLYNGSIWVNGTITSGVTDHGALTGLSDDDHSQYLLANGSRTGATSSRQVFTSGITTGSIRPPGDSVNALQLQKADGTEVVTVDTTNISVGVNTPIARNARVNIKAKADSASEYFIYAERYNGAERFYVDTLSNMRLWSSLLISDRVTSIGTRGLAVEKGGSGNVTALDVQVLQPSTMTGTHVAGNFSLDIRPNANNFSGVAIGAKYTVSLQTSAGSTSSGQLIGANYSYSDSVHYGSLSEINLCKFDGVRLQRSGSAVSTLRCLYVVGNSASANSGVITNFNGIEIGNITYGTNNYSIYTNAGLVRFGDRVILSASTTNRASMTIIAGTTPTSPNDGDIWYDGSHLYCRIAGVTKQLDN